MPKFKRNRQGSYHSEIKNISKRSLSRRKEKDSSQSNTLKNSTYVEDCENDCSIESLANYDVCDDDTYDVGENHQIMQFEEHGPFDEDQLTDSDTEESLSSDSSSSDSEQSVNESEDENALDLQIESPWYQEALYENAVTTVGEAVLDVLYKYIKNKESKRSLNHTLEIMSKHLPKPNKLPKSKYHLLKLLDKLIPNADRMVTKFRLCEDCSGLLGEWATTDEEITCFNCQSQNTKGEFFQFDIGLLIKNLFEFRNLGDLLLAHKNEVTPDDDYVSGITTGSQYKIFQENELKNDFDVCLLWNVDDTPIKKSSKAHVCMIQSQICNIPLQKRRNFQFVSGIFYSRKKNPKMNSFFMPFVQSLRTLSTDGITWYNKKEKKTEKSIVIAPIATCDAPARADVQNLIRSNGERGCFVCEVKGSSCAVGSGHNTIFICDPVDPPERRTKERMHDQAKACVENSLEQVMGVKGPSVVSLIPQFDISKSFLPDPVHVIFLGIFKNLLSLWLDTCNWEKDWYMKNSVKEQLDRELVCIKPPDCIMRTPRRTEERKFFKANEFEQMFLSYFPVLLKNKLKKAYYEHFLLIAYATKYLSKSSISNEDIDHVEYLINLFLKDMIRLYGRERITYNAHVLSHMCEYVRMYGTFGEWTTYPFEDFNGFIKSIVHGKNNIDKEVVNTLKICNAYSILKHVMGFNSPTGNKDHHILKKFKDDLNEAEITKISEFCRTYDVDSRSVEIFSRIHLANEVYTSTKYNNQKKRDNSQICWLARNDENNLKYGTIQLFLKFNDTFFVLVRELVAYNDTSTFNKNIKLPRIHVLVRPSCCLHIIELTDIRCKIMRIMDYVCLPEWLGKK